MYRLALCVLTSGVFLAVGALLVRPAIAAPAPRIDVCHIPPGNPANFHTITISENALAAHLAHGDVAGACNSLCAEICDDGDACTVDDTADCEQVGCPITPRDPVDCDDGQACTTDSCDSALGCQQEATCAASDLCHVAVCTEPDGVCEETEVTCPAGQQCILSTGLCESCFDIFDAAGSGDLEACIDDCNATSGCPEGLCELKDPICASCVLDGALGNCEACQSIAIDFNCTNACPLCPCSGLSATSGEFTTTWDSGFNTGACFEDATNLVLASFSGGRIELITNSEPNPGVFVCAIFADFDPAEDPPSADLFIPLTTAEIDACDQALRRIAAEDGVLSCSPLP